MEQVRFHHIPFLIAITAVTAAISAQTRAWARVICTRILCLVEQTTWNIPGHTILHSIDRQTAAVGRAPVHRHGPHGRPTGPARQAILATKAATITAVPIYRTVMAGGAEVVPTMMQTTATLAPVVAAVIAAAAH